MGCNVPTVMQPSVRDLSARLQIPFMKSLLFSALLLVLLGGGLDLSQAAVLGKDWTLQRPKPTSDNLRSIAVNGTASLVTVGGHGAILTATTLTGANVWSLNTVTGLTADLWDVVYTGSKYVIVGSSGTILTAPDTLSTTPTGLTWTAIATSTTDATKLNPTDQYNAVAVSGSTLVAAGATKAGGGVVAISTDGGTTWARKLVASSTALKSVTFQNSTIWAVMDGYLLRSLNSGVSWTLFSLGGATVTSVAYAVPTGAESPPSPALSVTGSASFIAVNGGALGTGTAPANLSVLSLGAELVGVTRTGQLLHSDNAGVFWQTLSTTQTTPFNKATRFGSVYVAVGDGGSIQSYVVGGAWTSLTSSGTILAANGVAWNEKLGSDSLYVAVGSGITWTSADGGVTWTEHIQNVASTTTPLIMLSVMWSGSYFVAVGSGLWVSSDGVTWTSQVSAPPSTGRTSNIFAIDRLGGTPYAMGYDTSKKLAAFSAGDSTGFGWSPFTTIPGAQWAMLGITKSDAGLFVAVGWGGRVITNTAPGTKAWSSYTVALATGEDFTDVIWANSQFTAVTSKGGIWTSTNGSTWTKRKAASQPLWCITRVKHAPSSNLDDQFIAAGSHGLLVTSFNGQEWAEGDIGSSQFTNQILSVPSTTVRTETHHDTQTVKTVTTTYTLDTTAHTLTTNVKRETATSPVTRVVQITTLNTNPLVERTNAFTPTVGTADVVTTNDDPVTVDSTLTTAPDNPTPTVTSKTEQDTSAKDVQQDSSTDAQLVAVGGYGAFRTSTGDAPVQTKINFEVAASTISENGGSSLVTVNISAANPLPVTVTFGFAGTAPTSTYKRSVASVTFPANDTTSKTVLITPIQDSIDRHNATVIISMASVTGDARAGSVPTHTVTINDDERAPNTTAIVDAPIVYAGTAVTLSSSATYTGTPTWQWQKNGANISGAVLPYYLMPNVTLADAASYTLSGKNAAGTGVSSAVKLAVLDHADQIVTAKTSGGTYPTLVVKVAGAGLTYQWQRNGTDITDAKSASLALSNTPASNNDQFVCQVTVPATDSTPAFTLPSGTFTLILVNSQPVVTPPSLSVGQVGQAYTTPLPVAQPAASFWVISGLPAGLTYVSGSGAISGTPAKAGTFTIKFQATNAFGTLAPVSVPLVITQIVSGAVGTYMAVVDADSTVNQGLGGRLDVVTTTAGAFTGKLTETGGTYPFYGNLGGTAATSRDGVVLLPGKRINFTLSDSGAVSGTVVAGATSVGLTGWRKTTVTATRAGNYNIALNPNTVTDGAGYMRFTIKTTGDITMAGKLPSGTAAAYTSSAYIGPTGELGVFQPIFAGVNKGSIAGRMILTQAVDVTSNSVVGDADFSMITPPAVTPTVASFTVDGGRYIAPASGKVVMNLTPAGNNAKLTFQGADLATDSLNPNGLFTITAPAKVLPPNPNDTVTGLSIVAATGEFSGTFSLFDNNIPRTSNFFGVLIRPSGSSVMIGKGFFVLPALSPATGILVGKTDLVRNP